MITEEDMARITERDFVHVLRLHAWEAAHRQLRLRWIERWILWPGAGLLAVAAVYEIAKW